MLILKYDFFYIIFAKIHWEKAVTGFYILFYKTKSLNFVFKSIKTEDFCEGKVLIKFSSKILTVNPFEFAG
jgi:hypothetical protein